jgi:hypothetical protein
MKRLIAITIVTFVLIMSLPACMEEPSVPAPQPELPAKGSLPPVQPPLPAPEPAPEPAPKPDEPEYSEEEICSLIWNRIPSQLPSGHSKNELVMDTRTATYEGDGKWIFSVSGKVKQEGPLTTEIVKTADYWVERESCEVTSYELQLRATYYEKTKTLDIENVNKLNEKVATKTSDTPILRKEIKLKWLNVWASGYAEGSIENIGKIPIDGLIIEIVLFDKDYNIIVVEKCNVTPDPIPSGERGKFRQNYSITGKRFYFYEYRFLLEGGQVFEYLEGSGEEEPSFFYEMEMKGI